MDIGLNQYSVLIQQRDVSDNFSGRGCHRRDEERADGEACQRRAGEMGH